MFRKIFSEEKDILTNNNLESRGNKAAVKAVRNKIMNVKIVSKISILLSVNGVRKMFVNI